MSITAQQGDSTFGTIYLVLYDDTPLHKENFLKLARDEFYDGTTFHRVIDGFVIQGGDPLTKDDNPDNDGTGGPDYLVPAEIDAGHEHRYGAVAAARKPDNINPERKSNGSQFYIVEKAGGTPFLNDNYTVFGRVIAGMEVVERIAKVPTDRRDRPETDVTMRVEVRRLTRKALNQKFGYVPPS